MSFGIPAHTMTDLQYEQERYNNLLMTISKRVVLERATDEELEPMRKEAKELRAKIEKLKGKIK